MLLRASVVPGFRWFGLTDRLAAQVALLDVADAATATHTGDARPEAEEPGGGLIGEVRPHLAEILRREWVPVKGFPGKFARFVDRDAAAGSGQPDHERVEPGLEETLRQRPPAP